MKQTNTPHTAAEDWPSRILVAEDDPVISKLMSDFLLILGIPGKIVRDGQEAIAALTTDCFPLVFTDMHMPHIDGMQLIRHIKKHHPTTDVVAMTAYSQDYGLVDVIRAGAADYMTKPFTLAEFKAKIKRATRERALLQQLQHEIAKRRHSETDLSQQKDSLLDQIEQQKEELLETNAALRLILRQRDMEKNDLANLLAARFHKEISPYLEKLNKTKLQEIQRHYLEIIAMNLESIFLPASRTNNFTHKPFTEMEVKVVNLMKQGKTSKEIAAMLHVSPGTIRTHRENIRKKLQITNTKKNLYKTIISIL